MRPLRILHYPVHSLSGITNYILQNWAFIDRDRFIFDFCTRFQPDDTFLRLAGSHSRIFPVTAPLSDGLDPLLNTLSKAIDQGCDVLHLHTCHLFGGFPIEELAIKKGVPRIIVHAHNTGLDRTYSPADAEELLQRHEHYKLLLNDELATNFCACSEEAADWLFGPQISRNNIYLLKNAIDTQRHRFDPQKRQRIRQELGLNEELVVGHVGRISDQKNPFFLLSVFKHVLDKNKNARLVWVGDGPLADCVHKQALEMGDAVRFLGSRTDVPDLMQAFDFFLLPSLYEGLGIAVIEAQTAGLPCLCSTEVPMETKITGNIDYLPLAEPENIWAERILTMSHNWLRMDQSSAVVAAGYDIRDQVKRLEQFYLGNLGIEDSLL